MVYNLFKQFEQYGGKEIGLEIKRVVPAYNIEYY